MFNTSKEKIVFVLIEWHKTFKKHLEREAFNKQDLGQRRAGVAGSEW